MSVTEFERCTPDELSEIFESFSKEREDRIKGDWERTRQLAGLLLQPHLKKKVSPRDLMKFPWDNEPPEEGDEERPAPMSAEERKARYLRRIGKDKTKNE